MADAPSRRRAPKPATPARLEAAALHYLERFASSAANLRRVLMRRVERSARLLGTDRAEGAAAVEALIGRYRASGLLDDRAYAAARAASLHRAGASARAIAARLASKGVEREIVGEALGESESPDAPAPRPGGDLAAAAALARRRRIGPYRAPELRAQFRMKDLAAFARAGFARGVAERIMKAPDAAALEDLLHHPDEQSPR